MSSNDAIVSKFLNQGGDPVASEMLRYALATAPPPAAALAVLAHPDSRINANRATQQLAVRDEQGGLLWGWKLDVDDLSHMLGHALERYEASGGPDSLALATWVLRRGQRYTRTVPFLYFAGLGYVELAVKEGEVYMRRTQQGFCEWEPLEPAFAAAKENDPCPCGSGRKFRRCCKAGVGATKRPG